MMTPALVSSGVVIDFRFPFVLQNLHRTTTFQFPTKIVQVDLRLSKIVQVDVLLPLRLIPDQNQHRLMYSSLFDWVVGQINSSQQVGTSQDAERKAYIGLLDTFGFEILKTNSLEQLAHLLSCELVCNFVLLGVV